MQAWHAHTIKNIASTYKIVSLILINTFFCCFSIYAQNRHYNLNSSVGLFTTSNLGKTPRHGTIALYAKLASKNDRMDAFTAGSITGCPEGNIDAFRFAYVSLERSDTGFVVVINGTDPNCQNSANTYSFLPPSQVHLNTWYRFVFTWNMDVNNAKGYENGKEVFNQTTTLWPSDFSHVLVGAGWDTLGKWDGGLDQIMLWKREFTKDEVKKLESWKINFEDTDLMFHLQSPPATYYGKNQSVLNMQATCFCQDNKGFIWMGTNTGLRRFDGLHYKYHLENQNLSYALHSNFISAVFEDSRHRLWVGTNDDGIYLFNYSTDKFYSYNLHCTQKIKDILSIEEDGQKRIWLNTTQDDYILNEKINCFELNKDANAELSKEIYTAIKDSNGNRWWLSGTELKLYDAAVKKIYDHKNNPYHISILDIPSLESITIDTKNNLWACNNSNAALYKYNITDKKMEVYAFPLCLETKSIKDKVGKISLGKIFADHHNNIWLSLPGIGLVHFDTAKNKFSIVAEDNNSYAFYDSSLIPRDKNFPVLEDAEGNIWAGGFTNFIFFHPVSDSASAPPGNVVITEIELANASYLSIRENVVDSLLENNLPFHVKKGIVFNIKYASLQFSHADKIKYYQKMEGYDGDWTDIPSDKYATFVRLPVGHYLFHVKCENQYDISCKQETVLEIYVDPLYWQTWWFRTLLILITLALIYWLISLRIKYIRKKEAEKNALALQMAALETKALRSQMNPHFIFNALNAIKKFLLKNDVPNADRYLSSFAKLLRLILENTRENSVLLENEIKLLQLYLQLEHLRFEDKLEYLINVDEKINTAETEIPSMIIQPFVENAIVHGIQHKEGKGMVKINFQQKEKYIEVVIEDDGVGRLTSATQEETIPHKSLAIKISEERLTALRKNKNIPAGIDIVDLNDTNGNPTGTKVIICIPLE